MRFLLLLCLAVPALSIDVSQNIIGGSDSAIANYPHQLSLRVSEDHTCAASMIANNRAVTAAHCTGRAVALMDILGGSSVYTDTACSSCVLRSLDWVNRNPYYDENAPGYPNDIAVLGFTAIFLNANLNKIGLATTAHGDFDGTICTITGWGSTTPNGPLTPILQHATMTIISNAECSNFWDADEINDGHICASDANSSPCDGDSGGPLECNDILVGVGSWGDSTCDPSSPAVFARISYFQEWIIQQ